MKRKITFEEIINSLDGISRAKAPAFLYTRIEAKLTQGNDNYLPVKPIQLAGISIFMAAIISLNIFVIYKNSLSKIEQKYSSSVSVIVNDYGLNTEQNLYFE